MYIFANTCVYVDIFFNRRIHAGQKHIIKIITFAVNVFRGPETNRWKALICTNMRIYASKRFYIIY